MNVTSVISAKSQAIIEYLLDQSSTSELNSTLTLWGTDNISQEAIEEIKIFIEAIGKQRVYVDTAYDLNSLQSIDESTVSKFPSWSQISELFLAFFTFNFK